MNIDLSNNENKFGTIEYKHGQVVHSKTSSFKKFSSSVKIHEMDMVLTCLYIQSAKLFGPGVNCFLSELPNMLKKTINIQMIDALESHEKIYWEDAVKLFRKPGFPGSTGNEWDRDRFYIVITKVAPMDFPGSETALISIDITDLNQSEMDCLLTQLYRLCDKNKHIYNSGKYIKPLVNAADAKSRTAD